MSSKEKQIQKNLKLSAAFSGYVVSHPKFAEGIPDNAEIIFSDKNDPALKRHNLSLVQGSKEGVYEVQKRGSSWKVIPLAR